MIFYAMEKVLRANDDDVIVYVAPTKALVNQIAAEVMSKFKKNYRPGSGKSCFSIYTRDIRVKQPTKAQVLVTVPYMLSNLMMSPANKDWVPRIKCVIFDEVHSISQAEDGLIWEQLIMSVPCQIIALSAAVGNVEAFSSWLSFARVDGGPGLTLIQHAQRYSELRKYIYKPKTDEPDLVSGLPDAREDAPPGLQHADSIHAIHPLASIVRPERGLSADLSLESRDCLSLWQAMEEHQTSAFKIPSKLAPHKFFAGIDIVKADVIRLGSSLKSVLSSWMTEPASPANAVLVVLSKIDEVDGKEDDKNAERQLQAPQRKSYMRGNMDLFCELRTNKGLPAILFNYNRKYCEDMAMGVLKELEAAEEHYKSTNTKYKTKLAKYQRMKDLRDVKPGKQKNKGNGSNDEEGLTKMERQQEDFHDHDALLMHFDPDKPLDAFSFADVTKADNDLFNESVKRFQRKGIPKAFITAFHRGIGVHHSGMNKHYGQVVEVFFRRGFLTVIIATGTLCLGINAPCKTVVFAGDSVYLNALNYRKASGRAGRRGFDDLGNVVFHNIPQERVLRLMGSRLPDINGHWVMTTLFVLRLFTMLHGTDNADYAMNMVDTLLSRARLSLTNESFKNAVQHHVRFSIEYLRSQGIINQEDQSINLASLVSHLYYAEKGALAFHALLERAISQTCIKNFALTPRPPYES